MLFYSLLVYKIAGCLINESRKLFFYFKCILFVMNKPNKR